MQSLDLVSRTSLPASTSGAADVESQSRADIAASAPQLPSSGRHILALDGVRGVAVLMVLLSSVVIGQQHATRAGAFFIKVLGAGWWGVNLFFVLSGFLITGILLRTKTDSHYFRNFYCRRALRVFPLYFALLVVAFVVLPMISSGDPARPREMASGQWWLWTYLANVPLAIHNDWWQFKGPHFSLGHLWSLAVEEHFYLFWPLVVYLFSPRRLVQVCVLLIVFAFAARCWCMFVADNSVAGFVFTPCRMDGLALGALLAVGLRQFPDLRVWRGVGMLAALVGGLAFLGMLLLRHRFSSTDPFIGTLGVSILDWFSAGLLLLAVTASPGQLLGGIFESRLLRGFGRYSYSIYLLHPALHHIYNHWFSVEMLTRWLHSPILAMLIHGLLIMGFAYLAAMLTWYLLENRFLALKRFFESPSPSISAPASGEEARGAMTASLR